MKLCKDCKHAVLPSPIERTYGMYAKCAHHNVPIDPVYGLVAVSCDSMRSKYYLLPHCGADGDWFEQAPPAPAPVSLPEINETWTPPPKRGFFKRIFG